MANFILQIRLTIANFVLIDNVFTLPGLLIVPVDIPIRIHIVVGQ